MRKTTKPRVIFIFSHEYESMWRDGLFAALNILSFDFEITLWNLNNKGAPLLQDYDFALGWGAFGSPADNFMKDLDIPKGLCIAGNAMPPLSADNYNVLFYETEWYRPQIDRHRNIVHAFGINSDIYKPFKRRKLFDYITVGAFALWKRQELLIGKPGFKMAVGEIQRGNPQESFGIIAKLLGAGVCVSDMVAPELLATLYNSSKEAYIPADIYGGGERAVLEARSCGIPVTVESDNPKLLELLEGPIYDHKHYAQKLSEGILSCL